MKIPPNRTLAAVAVSLSLFVGACAPSSVPSPTASVESTRADTAPSPQLSPEIIAASAAVRDGVPDIAGPVKSVPITAEGKLKGGQLNVWTVRSTDTTTRLEWSVSHPTFTGNAELLDEFENLPVIRAGDKVIRTTQYAHSTDSWAPVKGDQYQMVPEPRRTYGLYAAIPEGVSEVTITSLLSSEAITVPVERGADPVPAGTANVPIRARNTSLDVADVRRREPLTVTVHGVRRVDGHTILYYSAALPEGAPRTDLSGWSSNGLVLSRYNARHTYFNQAFGLVDRTNMLGYESPGSSTRATSSLTFLGGGEPAAVGWVVFAPLPADVQKVDVVLGSKQLVLDVPVEDGPLAPAVPATEGVLGAGWPQPGPEALAMLTPDALAESVTQLRDSTREGAITDLGEGIELDTAVLFAYNEATLTPEARGVIDKAASILAGSGRTGEVAVVGHTDADGSDSYNKDLSQRRAQAVADALAPLVGGQLTFAVQGKGEEEPIASNDTEEGKALNRRVSIQPPEKG